MTEIAINTDKYTGSVDSTYGKKCRLIDAMIDACVESELFNGDEATRNDANRAVAAEILAEMLTVIDFKVQEKK